MNSFKERFNELAEMKKVYEAWGEAVQDILTKEMREALFDAVTANNGEKIVFTALDMCFIFQMEATGPECFGIGRACDLLLKYSRQADFDMSILLPFMNASRLPAVSNPDRLKDLSKKYGLPTLLDVLQKAS